MSTIEYPYEDGIKLEFGGRLAYTITKFNYFPSEPPTSDSPEVPFDVEVLEVWVKITGREPFKFSPEATEVFYEFHENEIREQVSFQREAEREAHILEGQLAAKEVGL